MLADALCTGAGVESSDVILFEAELELISRTCFIDVLEKTGHPPCFLPATLNPVPWVCLCLRARLVPGARVSCAYVNVV